MNKVSEITGTCPVRRMDKDKPAEEGSFIESNPFYKTQGFPEFFSKSLSSIDYFGVKTAMSVELFDIRVTDLLSQRMLLQCETDPCHNVIIGEAAICKSYRLAAQCSGTR